MINVRWIFAREIFGRPWDQAIHFIKSLDKIKRELVFSFDISFFSKIRIETIMMLIAIKIPTMPMVVIKR